MSYSIGLDTLHLRPTPRIAHVEWCDHAPLKRTVEQETGRPFVEAWDYDFDWLTDQGPTGLHDRGRVTDMGHASYVEAGADFRDAGQCPFTDVEEVYAFDAVEEYGLFDFDELVSYYENLHQQRRVRQPDLVEPGGYYMTIVSGAIAAFGWEMLLEAAAEPDRFAPVLESFKRLTMHHVKAWAATSIEAFIQHDDFVWSSGPFMDPAFYRKAIIPGYAELWQELHNAGKKVIFCSDGNWIEFIDDIAEAGADGFIFEPMMPLEPVVERYGASHVIMSSKVDARTLSFGTIEQIRAEIDATLAVAKDCPGLFFSVGNHIPVNVPIEHARFYIDYLREHWTR